MKRILYLIYCLMALSCGDKFLDVKPSSDTVVPTTLDDFQQLLDAILIKEVPELLDVQADDFYLLDTYWQSTGYTVFKNTYIWADDIYETIEAEIYGWNTLYEQIFYANVVLDGLQMIAVNSENQEYYNHIKGSALFTRAMALHYLVQLYAPAYHPVNATTDLGVPIPLSSDVNEKVKRESVDFCFKRMLGDLEESIPLLRDQVDFGRPSKAASYALLARIYLMMGEYKYALLASENLISFYGYLTDLNDVSRRDFKESIYLTFMAPATFIRNNSNNALMDKGLYNSYQVNDLRKSLFFRIGTQGLPIKIDGYGLGTYCFSGLDTDEQYLIKAESEARLGSLEEAMKTLNYLLKHVYSDYVDQTASTQEEALALILQERRKQLIFRGLRWSDLKRYNRDGANITLTRKIGDKTYTLKPNSPNWLFPIPTNEIKTSGIPQNIRK